MLPTEILLTVTSALEELDILYCIGGSFASSVYGEPRATRDIDILVDLPSTKAEQLVARLESDFFIQLQELRDAIARSPTLKDNPSYRASCNLIHRTSFFSVDLYIASGRPYERAQFARRIRQTIATNPNRHAYFVSPEDIILIKLEWYRLANGVLDRQWNDVRSVIVAQENTLDIAYLRQWATYLAITDLLDAALRGLPPPLTTRNADSQQLRLDL